MKIDFGELANKRKAEKGFLRYQQTTAYNKVRGIRLRQRDIDRQERRDAKPEDRAREAEHIREEMKKTVATDEHKLVVNYAQLDASQRAAVKSSIRNQFSVIIGKAGTGKSTTAETVAEQLMEMHEGINIYFVTFMGRATQQLKLRLEPRWHPSVSTIHRFLGYRPEEYYNEKLQQTGIRFVPTYTLQNKIPNVDIVLVDEAGSVSVELWNKLYEALPTGAKVILMGDINQIRPVNGHSILGYAMNKWPVSELTTIHRQAAENPIIAAAHSVLEGKMPRAKPGDKRFALVRLSDTDSNVAYGNTISIIDRMAKEGIFDPLTDVLLTPQNVGNIGREAFNKYFAPHFNKPILKGNIVVNKRVIVRAGGVQHPLAPGDKVMFLANDYESGITNGMIGVITEININPDFDHGRDGFKMDENFDVDKFMTAMNDINMNDIAKESKEEEEDAQRAASHVVTVMFEAAEGNIEKSLHTIGALRRITHAYAITVHKSQGGEYPTVVILLHSAHHRMWNREMLYTAITRGKNRVVLIYNTRGIQQALNKQAIKGDTIEEKAASFFALEEKISVRQKDGEDVQNIKPLLPKPHVQYADNLDFLERE